MNSTISAILVQKRTPAMRSQIFFGGTKGNSVSAGVGMPCKKKRLSVELVICLSSKLTVTKSISVGFHILVRKVIL